MEWSARPDNLPPGKMVKAAGGRVRYWNHEYGRKNRDTRHIKGLTSYNNQNTGSYRVEKFTNSRQPVLSKSS